MAENDAIQPLLRELMIETHPDRELTEAEVQSLVSEHLDGRPAASWGNWFWYPWSGQLIHLLPEDEFTWLRTRRNRFHITDEEQARLAQATVGVIGLSVGRSVAAVLAMEGIAGQLRLADFDHLELSNLNRLRAPVTHLGQHKAIIAARELAGINPYLDVRLWQEGVTVEEIDPFLAEDGGVDVLIEECDDLRIKLRLRQRARALGIPVVMDTSDKGLLDVERFDLDPDRPILHGLLGAMDPDTLIDLPMDEKLPIVIRILGGGAMSARAAASMAEIEQTIRSWPQLASDVALGGAVAAHVTRRILLGDGPASGRYYVDVDQILQHPLHATAFTGALAEDDTSRPDLEPVPDLPRGAAHLGVREIQTIVEHGIRAPSAHNAQPWRFRFTDGQLEVRLDPDRCLSHLDFENGAAWLSIGAAIENMVLAAEAMGHRVPVQPFPDPGDPWLGARLQFEFAPAQVQPSDLAQAIEARHCNRRQPPRVPLSEAELNALHAALPAPATLHVVDDAARLERLAPLVGQSDRLSFLHEGIHSDIMAGMRWTRAQVEATRDGLDVMTLEVSPAERAAMQMLSKWSRMSVLKTIGGGKVLTMGSDAVKTASAVVLITTPGTRPASYLSAGRAMERVWLRATRLGLAVTPLATLPYLFARLERGEGQGLSTRDQQALRAMRPEYNALFNPPAGVAEGILLRLAKAPPTRVRSLRRPLSDVLEFA